MTGGTGNVTLQAATLSAITSPALPIVDDFNDGNSNGWVEVDEAGAASSWSVISGEFYQVNRVESVLAFDQSYHLGSYAYLQSGMGLTDYRFSVSATYLASQTADDIGVMFRYQDNNNYYRLSFNSRYGFTRLEKKVGGVFTPLASDARGYGQGQQIDIEIEVNGSRILVFVNGDPLFAVQDNDLKAGTVALYNQDQSKYDNVVIQQIDNATPRIVISSPAAHSVVTANVLDVSAMATNVPFGGYVEFVLDGGVATLTDTLPPYTGQFTGVSQGNHTIEAILRDDMGLELARDTNVAIGASGDYAIALGDSIHNGVGDNFAYDNIMNQAGRILSFQGLETNLTDLLEAPASTAYPNIVINEAIGGDESADTAFTRVNSILARNAGANRALLLLGTNDAGAMIPSGTGCSGSACAGTYKGNMQSLVDALVADGLEVWVGLVPPAFGSGDVPYGSPLTAVRNTDYVQAYNQVIQTELTGIQVGPDFFGYFLGPAVNRFSLFSDTLHPNALGHVVMAQLWHNALTGRNDPLPFVLENLVPSTAAPYLKQNLLEAGDTYYVDAGFTLTSIPALLQQGRWIMTANADAGNASTAYISFDVDRPVSVYVAYDQGATVLPAWMNGYVNTGLTLGTSDPAAPVLALYRQDFAAGSIVLGGNAEGGGNGVSNYVVIVTD